jgi:hypothetical protein
MVGKCQHADNHIHNFSGAGGMREEFEEKKISVT